MRPVQEPPQRSPSTTTSTTPPSSSDASGTLYRIAEQLQQVGLNMQQRLVQQQQQQSPSEGPVTPPPPPPPHRSSVAPPTNVERRRPKPGILRLDMNKPRRSSGGSVEFRMQPQMLGEDITSPTGTQSPHQLTVTWATSCNFDDQQPASAKHHHPHPHQGTPTNTFGRPQTSDFKPYDNWPTNITTSLVSPTDIDFSPHPLVAGGVVSPTSGFSKRNLYYGGAGGIEDNGTEQHNTTGNAAIVDDEDEDYSISVSAIMQRRASVRGYRNKRNSRSSRRASSPMDHVLDNAERRRSSVYTTSSDEGTNQESTQEQIFENIRLHKEVIQSVKLQPWPMRKKLKLVRQAKTYVARHEGALQERFAMSRSTKDLWARFKILMAARWRHWKRETASFLTVLIPWELRIKEIESHFGSGVASYFTFLRWLMWVNIMIAIPLVAFVIGPEYFATKHDETDPRKKMSEQEFKVAGNLFTFWEFEGYLKYSPMFYGYYSSFSGASALGYKLPLAYFLTAVVVYIYSFVATLRKMAENSRNSKLSSKDDECTFSWKLFTGWDFMIGHAETAHNRIASVVVGFKEALLEEAEKKKDNRNWRIILQRILVNILVMGLLAASGYTVVALVNNAEKLARQDNWLSRNAVNVTMTLLSFFLPMIFEALGLFENWHPRQQLRLQLARIMILNMLNLYSLMFSFIYNINSKETPLQLLKEHNETATKELLELTGYIESMRASALALRDAATSTALPLTTTTAMGYFDDLNTSTTPFDDLSTHTSTMMGFTEDGFTTAATTSDSLITTTMAAASTLVTTTLGRMKCYNVTLRCNKKLSPAIATTALVLLNLTTTTLMPPSTLSSSEQTTYGSSSTLPTTTTSVYTTNDPATTITTENFANFWTTMPTTKATTTTQSPTTITTEETSTMAQTTVPSRKPSKKEMTMGTTPRMPKLTSQTQATTGTASTTTEADASTTPAVPATTNFFDYYDYFAGMAVDEVDNDDDEAAVGGERAKRQVDAARYPEASATTKPLLTVRPWFKSRYSRRRDGQSTTEDSTATTTSQTTTTIYPRATATYSRPTSSYPRADTPRGTTSNYPRATTSSYPGATTSNYLRATTSYTRTTTTYPRTSTIYPNQQTTTIASGESSERATFWQPNTKLYDILAYFTTSPSTPPPGAYTTTTPSTTTEEDSELYSSSASTLTYIDDADISTISGPAYFDAGQFDEDQYEWCVRQICEPDLDGTDTTTEAGSTDSAQQATTKTAATPLQLKEARLKVVQQTLKDVQKNLTSMCWETSLGQELSKVIVFDGIMSIVAPLCIDFLRALFVRYVNQHWCWDMEKTFPQYGDFKIAENILTLINNQGQVWMGIFFSPGLVLINLVKLIIMMYFRSWIVLTCNVPHEVVFKASKSNNFYLSLLLTMLFLCVLPVGYAIVWLRPSWHCGPFSDYDRIAKFITTTTRNALPEQLHKPLNYLTSSSTVIPLLLLLILIIYYLVSLTGALREANQDLRTQLQKEREEERKKIFKVAETKPAEQNPNTLTSRWRKVLEASSPVTPTQPPDFETEEYKSQARKELISRIMKEALRKGSATSDDDSVVRRDDDDTDTEHHDSLPLDEENKEKRFGLSKLQQIRRTRKPSLVDIVQIAKSERERSQKREAGSGGAGGGGGGNASGGSFHETAHSRRSFKLRDSIKKHVAAVTAGGGGGGGGAASSTPAAATPQTPQDNDNDPEINSRIVNERRQSLLRRKKDDDAGTVSGGTGPTSAGLPSTRSDKPHPPATEQASSAETKPAATEADPSAMASASKYEMVDEKKSMPLVVSAPAAVAPAAAEPPVVHHNHHLPHAVDGLKLKFKKIKSKSHMSPANEPEIFKFDQPAHEEDPPTSPPPPPPPQPTQKDADTVDHLSGDTLAANGVGDETTTPPHTPNSAKQLNSEKFASLSRQGRKKIGSLLALVREAVNTKRGEGGEPRANGQISPALSTPSSTVSMSTPSHQMSPTEGLCSSPPQPLTPKTPPLSPSEAAEELSAASQPSSGSASQPPKPALSMTPKRAVKLPPGGGKAPLETGEELDQPGPITFPMRSASHRRRCLASSNLGKPLTRQDSQASVWSDNIPTITISSIGSVECIAETVNDHTQAVATGVKSTTTSATAPPPDAGGVTTVGASVSHAPAATGPSSPQVNIIKIHIEDEN